MLNKRSFAVQEIPSLKDATFREVGCICEDNDGETLRIGSFRRETGVGKTSRLSTLA
jgi:hypothetical protein